MKLWVLVIILFICATLKLSSSCTEEERIGLLKLKSHLPNLPQFYDDPLVSWVDDEISDCCRWNLVECDNTNSTTHLRVIRLYLNNTYIENGGILDASLFLPFQQLQYLDLSENGLSDLQNVPDLARLKKLKVLILMGNDFRNNIHIFQSLSTITTLTVLDLSNNLINGSLSDFGRALCKLKDLRELSLSSNYLSGSIPQCFNNLTSLKSLDLSWNILDGKKWPRLKELKVLILKGNSIHSFQSLSTITSLTVLDLSHNGINDGSLSNFGRGLCKLKNLRELSLADNKLSESIPECFNNLTSLKSLDLSWNNLVGILNPFSLSTSLEYFSLQGNPQVDANLMVNSLVNPAPRFQFKYLDLSDCNPTTSDLFKSIQNQPKLTTLLLSNNKLHGKFPNSFFKNNSRLKTLILKNNSLTGHIHFPTGPLNALEWFDVSYNHIQGQLQSNIGEVLPKLITLNMEYNNLGGGIPSSLGDMKDLSLLMLSDNNFSGKLPESLGWNWTRLEVIQLSNNRLEGRIPDTIFNSTDLQFLTLRNNQFTGHIPSNIFQPSSLYELDISQNYISGPIPYLSNSLSAVLMHDNLIEGYIPPQLCNLTSLAFLNLSHNQLSGVMPSCLTIMPSLQQLHLQGNKLTDLESMFLPLNTSHLVTLDLSYNSLSGGIPNWFGVLKYLKILLLKGNHFSGLIPQTLCSLHYLGIVDLSHNNLSGSIPLCFTKIPFRRSEAGESPSFYFLTNEGIVDSYFSSTIFGLIIQPFNSYLPTWTYQVDVEITMKSRSNSYKGDIINYVFGIDLSCNNLQGNIPQDIGALTEIQVLNLSHNQFTGIIPPSLSNMKQIESIDFSHNKLTGQIPSILTRLSTLVVFNMAYNNLSGRLPEMVAQFSTFNETSYEGNPFLCGLPLQGKQCNASVGPISITGTFVGHNDVFGVDLISFLASFAAAYVTCLLGFIIVLCINPYWRRRWFRFIAACLSLTFPFWSEAIYRREI